MRLGIITGLAWLLAVLLIAFLVTRFRFQKRAWLMLLAVMMATTPIIFSPGWDGKAIIMMLGIFALGLSLAVIALRRGERGSGLVVLGLSFGLGIGLMDPRAFADQTLFLSLDLLMACLLVSHAVQAPAYATGAGGGQTQVSAVGDRVAEALDSNSSPRGSIRSPAFHRR